MRASWAREEVWGVRSGAVREKKEEQVIKTGRPAPRRTVHPAVIS